ncbi:MAG: PilN domain-containing protein [Candidatus Omnitrophica bacterium]|nr:PilN domain-containing protein [Candidatus Omnitrophota bacterium]
MRLSVGIEISEQYLKLVAAKTIRIGQSKLFDCCMIEPVSALTEEQISKKIAELLQKRKWKARQTIVCLPRNLSTLRNLALPSQDRDEIVQMINLNIGRVVPYKKEEIVYGYQFLGRDELGYTKVMLAIVHADIVRKHIRIVEGAGLTIDKVVLSSYGVWQWTLSNFRSEIHANEFYMLLDCDSNFADLIVFNREAPVFNRSINLESQEQSLEHDIARLTGEIKQSLVIFQSEQANKKPVRLFLAGSSAILDYQKRFESELDMPVRIVPAPYAKGIPRNTSISALAESVLEDKGKTISFILPEIQIRKTLKERTKELIIMGSLLIYVFAIILALFWGRIYHQQEYLVKVTRYYQPIEQAVGDLVEKSRKVTFAKDFLYARQSPMIFLYELEKIVPPEITITFLDIEKINSVTLRGQGVSLSDVFKFVSTLEKGKHFKDIVTKYTRTKKVKDKEVTDFELTLRIAI